ncbi:MAG: RICIN domain-containing protein [Acidobacteriota bacterium]|nr:RICIN domain-containing protein [Acidobacteriota bacterium]
MRHALSLRSIVSACACFGAAAAIGTTVCSAQMANVLTFHNDNARTGQNLGEGILTPQNVASTGFGKLFTVAMDGKVDAQPLYVSGLMISGHRHNVTIAATEHDSVYAFDADSGTVYWHVTMLGAGETSSDDRGCDQVTPEIGVTATPVIDRNAGANGTAYLVAMSKDSAGNYYQRLHSIDLATGAEQSGSPINIAASVPGAGSADTFQAKQYKDRPGLLLLNGTVYTTWGSHCDFEPYAGWTIGYNQQTLHQTSVFNFAPNGSEAGPWNSGGAPGADAQGNIFYSLGNGTFDTSLNAQGFPSKGDFGNALIKLGLVNGSLIAEDYWTMYNSVSESGSDTDLGSGGLVLLPDATDNTGKTRHLIAAAGKDGNLYLADRDNMGKFDASSNATLYQELPGVLPNGIWSNPAYFNGNVYFGSVGSSVRSFALSNARLSAQPTSTTPDGFTYPGANPSISAFGTANAILWAVSNNSSSGLYAYNANNLSQKYYDSTQAPNGRDQFGPGNKFIVPTIANGKVFAGTTNSVGVFGLLRNTPAPIPDGDYILTNQSSGLVMDDPGSSASPGVQLIQWGVNQGPNQSWFFSYLGNGFYTIQNVSSGLYLTDTSSSPATPLDQQARAFNDTQSWALIATGSGYSIQNKTTGLAIDDPGFNANPGTGMILWPLKAANSRINQTWTIN